LPQRIATTAREERRIELAGAAGQSRQHDGYRKPERCCLHLHQETIAAI
jgi:hypothetical protein